MDNYLEEVPSAHIALASCNLGEPVSVTYKRFSKLSFFGLRIPEITERNLAELENIRFDEQDRAMITPHSDKSTMIIASSLRENKASVPFIVASAERLSESICDVLERLKKNESFRIAAT